jgi:exonuclease-1
MGVTGLLPCLQSITKHVSLEKYRGLTAAIDAMCWLHKGVFTGDVNALVKYQIREMEIEEKASETYENEQDKRDDDNDGNIVKRLSFDNCETVKKPKGAYHTQSFDCPDAKLAMSKCVDYVIRHAELIRSKFGIETILVIDGGSLPSKKGTNEKRRLDRSEAFKKGLEAEKRNDNREARKQFSRACSISHEIRHLLVIQCKLRGVPFLVAPYEADAQLAKLAHCGIADVIISEDSDLLAYACPRVLFKIDFKTGKGDEIQIMRDLPSNDSLSFQHWSHDMFVYMCILAGCDYCEGIPGVGIKTAHKYVRMYRNPAKIFKSLKASGKMPIDFEKCFWVAYKTFRHQRVYCPQRKMIESLNPMDEQGDNDTIWDYLGPWLEPALGIAIAKGDIHPTRLISWDQVELDRLRRHSQSSQPTNKYVASSPQISHTNQFHKQRNRDDNESPVKDDLFAFFKQKKSHSNPKRPPLTEIQLNQNFPSNEHITAFSVPSNPHEYSSKLVATSFQLLSKSQCSNRFFQKRKGASRAIRKLKNRLSIKKVLEKENAKRVEISVGLERAQEPLRKTGKNVNNADKFSHLDVASEILVGQNYSFHQTDMNFEDERITSDIQLDQTFTDMDGDDAFTIHDSSCSKPHFDYENPKEDDSIFDDPNIEIAAMKSPCLDEGNFPFVEKTECDRVYDLMSYDGETELVQNSKRLHLPSNSTTLQGLGHRESLLEVKNLTDMNNTDFDYGPSALDVTEEGYSYNHAIECGERIQEEGQADGMSKTGRDFLDDIEAFQAL